MSSCDCGTEVELGPERTVGQPSLGDVQIGVVAQLRHKHWARFHGEGKWGFDDKPRDVWHILIELRASRAGHGPGQALALMVSDSAEDESTAQKVVDHLGLEHCKHPSGKAIVFRITGAPSDAFEQDAMPLTVGDWRAVYILSKTAALARQRIAAGKAATCEAAAARFAEPKQWLARELESKADESEKDDIRRVAVLDGKAASAAKGTEAPNSVGFLVAVEEGLLLDKALDWALRHNQQDRADVFVRHLAKSSDGEASDLERRVLSRLEPRPVTPSVCPIQDDPFDRLVLATSDQALQRQTVQRVASLCLQKAPSELCHSWRMRSAAALVAKLGDTALCDLLLATLPHLGTHSAPSEEECVGDSADVERQLALLRQARRCGSAKAVYRAALQSLGMAPIRGRSADHCELDPASPAPNDACNDLSMYAAAILVASCRPDTAREAAALVTETNWWYQRIAALCVVGRCGGRDAFTKAAAKSGLTAGQIASVVGDCGIDQSWLPNKNAPPGSASAPAGGN